MQMLDNATNSTINFLKGVVKVIVIGIFVVALWKWAHNHPEQAQNLFERAMTTTANAITWLFDQIDQMTS